MRVGLVTPRYPPVVSGGGEISVKLLADQLSNRGHDVTVFSFDGGDETSVDGVPVHRFRHPPHAVMEAANAYAAYELWRHRDELASLDVVHAYNVTLTPAVGAVASHLDRPSVATLNSYDLLPKSAFGVSAEGPRRLYELLAMPTTGRLLRRAVCHVDRFVTLSAASRDLYREHGFDCVPVDVVPNMLDPSFAVPDAARDDDGYELLYVGSLIREKGVEYLVRAMSELPRDVTLRIVGDGDERARLESLVTDLGVDDRVAFAGHLPYEEVRAAYAEADCFVHPGVWPEPFGRTILEAMQAGLPVVATAVGGPAEVVPQDELLVPPRDPNGLDTGIRTARERSDVGAENREYVTERFAPERIVGALLDVYGRAID